MAAQEAPPEVAPRDIDHAERGPRATDLVTCYFSGRIVPRSQASPVKLGPGQRVWMHDDLCRDG